jgi:hypothetical protein
LKKGLEIILISTKLSEMLLLTKEVYIYRIAQTLVLRLFARKVIIMSKKLQQIEWLSGGKALLEKRPANDFFPTPHWYLQTANEYRFGNISKNEVIEVALDFLWDEAVEQERAADLLLAPCCCGYFLNGVHHKDCVMAQFASG